MAVEEPIWKRYLDENTRPSIFNKPDIFGSRLNYLNVTPPVSIGTREITDEGLAESVERDIQGQIAAESLGVEPTGKAPGGFLTRALRTITYVPSALVAGTKEFIYDPFKTKLVQLDVALQDVYKDFTPEQRKAALAETEDVSLAEFRKNINERNFAQEIFPQLAYDPKTATGWEKAIKEGLGLAVDIASTGGFGGGVRFASVLGRKGATETLENAARDTFIRVAKKGADETDEAFKLRASDFGVRAGLASLKGRSREVAKVFNDEFKDLGEDVGKKAFMSLDKSIRGGISIGVPGTTLASINSGGYLVDAVARNLGLKFLPKATDWSVKAYQNAKNVLRAGEIKAPVVRNAVAAVNSFLNNVGTSSNAWQGVIKAMVNKASEEDLIRSYKGFKAVQDINNFRNVRGEFVQKTNDLFKDVGRLKKSNPAAISTAVALYKNPSIRDGFVPTNETENIALNVVKNIESIYDEYYALLKANGFNVNYQNSFEPLLFVKGADRKKMADWLDEQAGREKKGDWFEAGPKNIPGKGYDPTKARTAFMKQVVDPDTQEVVTKPMRAAEIKEMFIRMGRKDLANLIEDDPFILLARYSTNVSRLLASTKIMDDIVKKGVLLRSDTPQLNIDQARLQQLVANPSMLREKDLDDFFKQVLDEPDFLGNYIETLNDDLARAYQTGDMSLKKDVDDKIETILSSMENLGIKLRNYKDRLETQLAKAEADNNVELVAAIKAKQAEAGQAREFLLGQRANLGQRTGVAGIPDYITSRLAQREGVEYRKVGSGIESAYYLPDEYARLHGTDQLVDAIERTLLLRKSDDKMLSKIGESFDEYTQFFRTGATFGRLTGFVLRNGIGAVQNNVMIAGSSALDHKVSREIASTRIYTQFGLRPFAQLTRADKAQGKIEKLQRLGAKTSLSKREPLDKSQVDRLKSDIDSYGFVQTQTVRDIEEEILERVLSKRKVDDNITQWDVYTAGKEAGIYDKYVVLPASQGLDADTDASAVAFIDTDPSRIVVRTDRAGKERGITQRAFEGLLNFSLFPTISADIAGRTIKVKPVQLTRDLNQKMEEFVRLAPIVTGLRKYGNTEQGRQSAGILMKAAQFDYSDLTDVERRFFRRALPFYTWSRNNVPLQVRSLVNNPERIRRNLAGWEAIGNIFSDEQGDTYVLPDYVGEMMGFVIDDDIRKDLIKKDIPWLKPLLANPFALRPETPALELERWTRGGPGTITQESVSASNPLLKAIISYNIGVNTFTKQPYPDEGVESPAWYTGFAKGISKLTGGEIDLGLETDPKTGDTLAPAKNIDILTLLVPQLGTLDRSAFPIIEAYINYQTGKDIDLSKYDDRAVSNVISQLGGINIVTVTPRSERSELYARDERRRSNIRKISQDYQIDPAKLAKRVSELYKQGLTRDEIIPLIEQARLGGEFLPDYLSGVQQ
jgi:hypothetical protein